MKKLTIVDERVIEKLIDCLSNLNEQELDPIWNLETAIEKQKSAIEKQAQVLNIKQLKRRYFWTRWLWWLTKVKDCKQTIKNWNDFLNDHQTTIKQLKSELLLKYQKLFGTYRLGNLMQMIINCDQTMQLNVDQKQICKFLVANETDYLDLVQIIAFNQPDQAGFVELIYRIKKQLMQTYYGSATFSYYNRKTKMTEYETLYATYQHWVPQIKFKRMILTQFKYDQSDQGNFRIVSHQKTKLKKEMIVDNEAFANHYFVSYDQQRDLGWLTWIDLLTQAQLVEFTNLYRDVHFQLDKVGNYLTIKSNDSIPALKISQIENLKSDLQQLLKNYEQKWFVLHQVFACISNLKRFGQVPRLAKTDRNDQLNKQEEFYHQLKHWDSIGIRGLDYYQVQSVQASTNGYDYQLKHYNYQIEKRTKLVATTGVYVGTKMVPVVYDHYRLISKQKYLIYQNQWSLPQSVAIVCKNQGQDLIINNRVWLHRQAGIKKLIVDFQTICQNQTITAVLTWDHYGLMISYEQESDRKVLASLLNQSLVIN